MIPTPELCELCRPRAEDGESTDLECEAGCWQKMVAAAERAFGRPPRGWRLEPSESDDTCDAYDLDDPKSPGYAERMTEAADHARDVLEDR